MSSSAYKTAKTHDLTTYACNQQENQKPAIDWSTDITTQTQVQHTKLHLHCTVCCCAPFLLATLPLEINVDPTTSFLGEALYSYDVLKQLAFGFETCIFKVNFEHRLAHVFHASRGWSHKGWLLHRGCSFREWKSFVADGPPCPRPHWAYLWSL